MSLVSPFGVGRPRVAAFGGGHGLYATLSALRRITDHITAIVTVADDGGSSGRLRAEFDCLPPGDLRMAIAALCGDSADGRRWANVLQLRFPGNGPLAGHALGNLMISGLWEELKDPVAALDMVVALTGARGRVLPMANVPLEIEADIIGLAPGTDEVHQLRGQAKVASTHGEVREIRLIPDAPPACPQALEAIDAADWVILGPGSWFTSVVPHLMVPELASALVGTSARRILTLNLSQDKESRGFSAARHIEVLAEHEPRLRLDYVLADQSFAGDDPHLETYVQSLGGELVLADLAVRDGSPRHDHLRLASVYAELMGLG